MDRRKAIQEAAGCALLGITPRRDEARNCTLLVGDRASGKSTILEAIKGFFPEDLVCAVPPSMWSSDYYRAALHGKAINIVTEIGRKIDIQGSWVKAILSQEVVTARFPYGEPFQFRPGLMHFFAANEPPAVDDPHDAFERRILAIPFDNGLAPDEVDPEFKTKLLGEREGIFAWMIRGAIEAVVRGVFTKPAGHLEIVLQMQHGEAALVEFAVNHIEKAPEGARSVPVSSLQEAFRRFLDAKGAVTDEFSSVTGARKRAAILKALYGAKSLKSGGVMHFSGIRLK